MSYTRTRTFVDNVAPVGGGAGPAISAAVTNAWEAAHQNASDRLDRVGVDPRDRGAVGDGVVDDAPVLRTILNAGGDIFLPAGTYRFVATSTTPSLPAGTRIRGVPGQTIISLETDTAGAYREFVRNGGDNVTIEGLTVTRAGDFPCVVFPVQSFNGWALNRVSVVGNRDTLTTNFCHGIQLGVQNSSVTRRVRIRDCSFSTCSFALFQANASTATIADVQVRDSVFSNNYGDDLEFNSPNGTTTGVRVESCVFSNNQSVTTGAGFAVGFAHISGARMRDCFVSGYRAEAVHIEDFAEDVLVEGNEFSACGTNRGSYIQVISGARRVRLSRNKFDATTNTNTIYAVSVQAGGTGLTPGGRTIVSPTEVMVEGNQFECGAAVHGIYFENVLRGTIANNQMQGSGSVATTTYGGGTNHALNVFAGSASAVIGNIIRGFLWGMFPRTDTVASLGAGSVVSANAFHECQLGLGATNSSAATMSGNVFYKCQYPMILGYSAPAALKSVVVANNNAVSCANPFGIYGVIQVAATAAAATGSSVSVSVNQVPNYIPAGTVFTFSGGGVLTLTNPAVFLATTLVGDLTGAAVANGEGASAYIPFSTDPTQNRLLVNNGDSFWGAAGYGEKIATTAVSYRLRGYENVVVASAAGITLTIPPAAHSSGRGVTLKNTSAGAVTAAAAGGNIDTATTASIAAGTALRLVSNGTNWLTV